MTTVTPGAVEVRQIDREAAWPFYRTAVDYPATIEFEANWMLGHLDHLAIIQAFARHRIAATPPDALQTVVEALREARATMEEIAETTDDSITSRTAYAALDKLCAALSLAGGDA